MIFGLIHYMIKWQNQIVNHSVQYWLCLLHEFVEHGSFISLSISLVQMLVECNGFDFESIESSIF
jgi:hypothetical protein